MKGSENRKGYTRSLLRSLFISGQDDIHVDCQGYSVKLDFEKIHEILLE